MFRLPYSGAFFDIILFVLFSRIEHYMIKTLSDALFRIFSDLSSNGLISSHRGIQVSLLTKSNKFPWTEWEKSIIYMKIMLYTIRNSSNDHEMGSHREECWVIGNLWECTAMCISLDNISWFICQEIHWGIVVFPSDLKITSCRNANVVRFILNGVKDDRVWCFLIFWGHDGMSVLYVD